jgi:hypothetical protein
MRLLALPVLLAAGSSALPALAAPSAYDWAFVSAFEAACVPGRLSYEASLAAAAAAGWVATGADSHPELAAIMAMAEQEALDPELTDARFDHAIYAKDIEGVAHHLVVSRASMVIGEPDDPLNPWVFVGCHLYNLDATQPVDPVPVTALIGNPISRTEEQEGALSHVWGPPCPMPRTGDTYLSFVAEGSPATRLVPFTGTALNFSTSELPEGEPVPDPYC